MQNVYRTTFRVRSYECDANGHVNNAVYQQYLEDGATCASAALGFPMAWYAARGETWFLRAVRISYLQPCRANDELTLTTWISSRQRVRSNRQYEVARGDGATVLRATAEWVYVDLNTGRPRSIPTELTSECIHETPDNVEPLKLTAPTADGRVFTWRHDVRRYELDVNQHVNNAVYLNWLEESKLRACAEAGWSLEKMRESDLLVLQTRHDTEYLAPVRYGDEVEIRSRLVDLRRVRGTWQHEMRRAADGALLARNYSSGAFLTLDGRPRQAPAEYLEALLGR